MERELQLLVGWTAAGMLVLLPVAVALALSFLLFPRLQNRPTLQAWEAVAARLGLSFKRGPVPQLVGLMDGRPVEVIWPGVVRMDTPDPLGFDISDRTVTGDETRVAAVFDGVRQGELNELVKGGSVLLKLGHLTVSSLTALRTTEQVRERVMAVLHFLEGLEARVQRPTEGLLEETFLREWDPTERARVLTLLLQLPRSEESERSRAAGLQDKSPLLVLAAASADPPDEAALDQLVRDEAVPAELREKASAVLSRVRRAEGIDDGNLSLTEDGSQAGALSIPTQAGAVSLTRK